MTPQRVVGVVQSDSPWIGDAAALLERHATWSLLTRLAWIAAAGLLLSLVVGGVAMYRAASIQNDQILDSRLEQFGATIQAIVEDQMASHTLPDASRPVPLKTRPTAALLYRYQVWTRDGILLMRSHEASASKPLVALTRFGYTTATIEGEEHRVFSLPGRDGSFVVQVAENVNEAWVQVGATAFYYVAFLLLPFGVLLGVTWWLLRRTLRSINALADALRQRNPLDVTLLPVVDPPRELVPIMNAIDFLFARMQRALSIERSFTSLAAHELRTPLAGVRANAQLLSYEELPEAPTMAVASLMQGVDRASHMLDQLLDLARVESLAISGELQMSEVRLDSVYQDIVHDLETRLRKRRIHLTSSFGDATWWCHGIALGVLMRNLLTNAINYSPEGGRVELIAKARGGELVLCVDDSGSGIAAEDREHAFERFNRLGRTQADGVGLGLSIVLLVVEMHGAKIQLLGSPLGGLRVQVTFPRRAGADWPMHANRAAP
jgi:signal transduction histidine kinase